MNKIQAWKKGWEEGQKVGYDKGYHEGVSVGRRSIEIEMWEEEEKT